MPLENIRYTYVWSTWIRLSHWIIAAGTLFQLASAGALKLDSAHYSFWLDWHLISGQILVMALALRVVLLFFPGSSHWRALLPDKTQRQAMLQMLKFYLSLARFPLPNWYAHNPLWMPLYVVFYIVLAGALISGLLYNATYLVFDLPMFLLHQTLANLIGIFCLFHIITVFLHDLKGKGACISAMVNGHRYFHFSSKDNIIHSINTADETTVQIPVDSIKSLKK